MGVALVAAGSSADVRFVGRVHVRVLLAVRTVRESTSAARELTSERPLTYITHHSHTEVTLTC